MALIDRTMTSVLDRVNVMRECKGRARNTARDRGLSTL